VAGRSLQAFLLEARGGNMVSAKERKERKDYRNQFLRGLVVLLPLLFLSVPAFIYYWGREKMRKIAWFMIPLFLGILIGYGIFKIYDK
jgi:hypothetical protein